MARVANFVLVAALLLVPSAGLAQRGWESRGFTGETDSLPHSVQLPPAAMALLMSDQEDFPDGPVKGLRCNEKNETPLNPDDFKPQLLCATVSLCSKPGTDYLVLGSGSLLGAHIFPSWIIHQDARGVSVLFKTRSDGLSIRSVRYHGYRELEADWVFQSGASILTKRYRFNGRKYVQSYSEETHN